ncbi:hypothetical protein TIFTF001_020134 [Ficus carica]|uniref:Uncharacterized protein n=1 Tax=Ficus carica TaxID=3494 RepID=A0AA88AR99_FICCA|nr:hypothetical protein TIFTF001_020134 [Ficus carica]
MSNHLSDSENDNLSGDVDITGSSSSIMSSSSDTTGEVADQGEHLTTCQAFLTFPLWIGGLAPVVDLVTGGDKASEMTASQASTSGREGLQSFESTASAGEPVHVGQRGRSRALHINDLRLYWRVDIEIVDLAGDRLVYTVDYFTSAVTLRYLAALREEFQIPDDIELVVPGQNDLSSRPPPSHITLSAEFF